MLQRFPGLATGLAVGGEDHLQQRLRQDLADRLGAAFHRLRENRLSVEQFACHTWVLAALTGEQPRRRGPVGAFAADHTGTLLAGGQVGETRARTLHGLHHEPSAVLEVRATHSGRAAHLGDVGIRVNGQPGRVALCQFHQRLWGARRQRQHVDRLFLAARVRRCHEVVSRFFVDDHRLCRRSLLDQHVSVGTGKSERTHPGPTRPAIGLPRGQLVDDLHRQCAPRDVR